MVEPKSHDKWLQRFRDCDAMEQEKVIQNELHPTTDLLSMGEVIRIINEKPMAMQF